MMGGSYYYNADRLRRKEYTDLVNKRKAQEKRDAWIRELEARDQEDKDWRQKLGKAKDFQREEKERQAAEDKKRGSDDGRGVINAVKEKLKDAKDAEVKSQTAEQKLMAEKRQEAERKQEVERRRQAAVKEKAGMGPDRRIWGEGGGGLFGWRHIKNWYNRPRGDGSKDDKSDGQ